MSDMSDHFPLPESIEEKWKDAHFCKDCDHRIGEWIESARCRLCFTDNVDPVLGTMEREYEFCTVVRGAYGDHSSIKTTCHGFKKRTQRIRKKLSWLWRVLGPIFSKGDGTQ